MSRKLKLISLVCCMCFGSMSWGFERNHHWYVAEKDWSSELEQIELATSEQRYEDADMQLKRWLTADHFKALMALPQLSYYEEELETEHSFIPVYSQYLVQTQGYGGALYHLALLDLDRFATKETALYVLSEWWLKNRVEALVWLKQNPEYKYYLLNKFVDLQVRQQSGLIDIFDILLSWGENHASFNQLYARLMSALPIAELKDIEQTVLASGDLGPQFQYLYLALSQKLLESADTASLHETLDLVRKKHAEFFPVLVESLAFTVSFDNESQAQLLLGYIIKRGYESDSQLRSSIERLNAAIAFTSTETVAE